MQKFVNTVAIAAAPTAMLVCLWQDYGLLVTVKRAVIAYLVFYGVASMLALIYKTGIVDDWRRLEQERETVERRRREQESAKAVARGGR